MTSASVPGERTTEKPVFTEKDAGGLVAMGIAALRKRCSEVLAERDALKAEVSRLTADRDRLTARLADVSGQYSKMSEHNAKLRGELTKWQNGHLPCSICRQFHGNEVHHECE